MSDMFDGDEFDYISSHKKRLAQEEARRKEEERLAQEQAKQKELARQEELSKRHAEASGVNRAKKDVMSHPPYGKPYRTDRKKPLNTSKDPSVTDRNERLQKEQRQKAKIEKKRLQQQRQKASEAEKARMLRRAKAEEKAKKERLAQEKRKRTEAIKRQKEIRKGEKEQSRLLHKAQKDAMRDRRRAVLIAYGARLATMIVIGLLLFAVSFAAFRITFGLDMGEKKDGYSYVIGKKESSLKFEKAFKNGVLYICGDDLASMCNLTVAGDESEIKYISPGVGNETASFKINTRTAYVNKNEVRLSSEIFKDDNGRIYIPLEFFSEYMHGVNIVNDEIKRTVTVSRLVINQEDVTVLGAEAKYADITFKIKPTYTIGSLDESVLNEEMPDFEYKIDIDPFEEYINPRNIFEYVKIINKKNPAEETFEYYDLIETTNQSVHNDVPVKLRRSAAKALEAMLLEAKADNVTRYAVFRGYVTFEEATQGAEKESYVSKYGLPQYDENLLGLTAEVYFGNREDSYGDSEVYKWFEKNAHRFGFIVRYPKGSEESTGVSFRPWTLRFVGRYSATKMYDEGLTLEQYVQKYGLIEQ